MAWLRPGYAPLMERWSSVPRRPPSTFSVFPFVEGPKVRIRLPPGESQERTRIPWPPRYNSRTWRIPVSAQSAAEIGFGRQMYEQHAGGAADRASTMTAAADIVGQEHFPAARSNKRRATSSASRVPSRHPRQPVIIPPNQKLACSPRRKLRLAGALAAVPPVNSLSVPPMEVTNN
jgi:hypothetical protein